MSRIGKKPIEVPANVEVSFDEASRLLKVKGAKGALEYVVPAYVKFNQSENQITLEVGNENEKRQRSIWGTARSLINNMIEGVSKGFVREVELNGVGFKMELGTQLTVYIGYSHPVKVNIPEGVKLTLEKNVLKGESHDKELIGNFFANLHDMRPADVYKHKGFKFPGAYYRKKVGKKTK